MSKEGKTICVHSPKGGVGKSVISLNLAGVASLMNYRVLMLDFAVHTGDVVIIDTGSKMDEINIVTLDSSDMVLFVIDNDLFTLKNTRNILNIFNDCNITNFKVLLNASIDFKTPYFSIMDMKKIIGANIDYTLSKDLFIKDITSYLYECKIPSLIDGFSKKHKEDYSNMKMIIDDLKRGGFNEEN